MELDVVVMAAGEGRRLRPLTEHWPKPVLPVNGDPVIATLVRELAESGAARLFVVTGHLAEQVESLLGDGAAFGVELRFVRQPRPDGSADAVRRALTAGAEAPLLVTAADTVFTRGDLGRFAGDFVSSRAAGAIGIGRVARAPAPNAIRVEGGRISRVLDDDPGARFRALPVWGLGSAVPPELKGLAGPPFELAEAFQRAIDAGRDVLAVELGPTLDLTYPVDLIRRNFPYLRRHP